MRSEAGEGGVTGWWVRSRTLSSLSLQGSYAAERGMMGVEPRTSSPLPGASGQDQALPPRQSPHAATCHRHPCTQSSSPLCAHSKYRRSTLGNLAPALTAQQPGCVGPTSQLPP